MLNSTVTLDVLKLKCPFLKCFLLLLGVTVSPLDETTYQIFAPSQTAMDEAKEMIDELLSEEVHLTVLIVYIFGTLLDVTWCYDNC